MSKCAGCPLKEASKTPILEWREFEEEVKAVVIVTSSKTQRVKKVSETWKGHS